MSKRNAIDQIEFMRNLLAFMLVGMFVGAIPALMWKAIPVDNEQLITYMMGQLSGMALMALGFYFVNKAGQDAVDAKKTENTGKLADAFKAAAQANSTTTDAAAAAEETAEAAADKAEEFKP